MNTEADIIIIGAGPAGLSLAASLANKDLTILIIEKQELSSIAKPKIDCREIALTHASQKILKNIGVWSIIDKRNISYIKKAQVFDESSDKKLEFSSDKLDKLGFLVANYKIKQALYNKVAQQQNVQIRTNLTVENITYNNNSITVETNNSNFNAKLVVAADSRLSDSRRIMGIGAYIKDYAKTMLVVNTQLEKPHENIALERFDFNQTIALLPMLNNQASFIITLKDNVAKRWLNYTDAEFSDCVSKLFNNKFGTITKTTKIVSYPLMGVLAKKFYTNKFAVVGDAAVTMHPVTAHGFNLGLRGANILANEISKALANGIDIGDNYVLKRYELKHLSLAKVIYYGTNTVVSLFSNDNDINQSVRKFVFELSIKATPINKLITHHLTSVSQL